MAEATDVAHAFSLFFHLVNLCEERERVRRLHAHDRQEAGAPMSLRHTFSELRRQKVPPAAVKKLLASMHVEPVLTAHPTEAKRRSVLNHILRLGRTLDAACGDLTPAAERDIDSWIEALWLTDEVREGVVTPEMESENARFFLERTIYDLAGSFLGKILRGDGAALSQPAGARSLPQPGFVGGHGPRRQSLRHAGNQPGRGRAGAPQHSSLLPARPATACWAGRRSPAMIPRWRRRSAARSSATCSAFPPRARLRRLTSRANCYGASCAS